MRFPFRGVIFDMDGLMLDTEPLYRSSMLQAAHELGYSLEEELHDRLLGRGIPEWRDRLIQIFGADYPQFRNRRRQLWEHHVQERGVAPKAGLSELLNDLDQERVLKGIATSSSKPDALLCLGPLVKRFEAVVTGDEVREGKPAPDIFLLAAQRLALSPEQCLVLEDSEPGAHAALAAGMSVIIVPDLQQPERALAAQVHRVCDSLEEVRKMSARSVEPQQPGP